jgi:hypothetical protein
LYAVIVQSPQVGLGTVLVEAFWRLAALTALPAAVYASTISSEGVSMKRRGVSTALGIWLLTAAMVCSQIQAQSKKPEPPMKLKVGDVAPDFKLQYFDGSDDKDVTLSQYRGKSSVVLAFYIFAFTGG